MLGFRVDPAEKLQEAVKEIQSLQKVRAVLSVALLIEREH